MKLYSEMLPIISLLFSSAIASHEREFKNKTKQKTPWKTLVKIALWISISEERRRENRQMHFVDPSFSSPTLSSHNGLDH